MKDYRLSERAVRDLDEIVDHLESIGADPRPLLGAIEARCLALARMPESGRSREDHAPGLRSGLIKNYLIFYVLDMDDIEVARIVHGRRDLGSIFRGTSD